LNPEKIVFLYTLDDVLSISSLAVDELTDFINQLKEIVLSAHPVSILNRKKT